MSELGRDARALLANARGVHDAPVDAKARVRAGLAAAIVASSGAGAVAGAGAGGGAQLAARAGAGAGAGWMTAVKIAVVLAVIGSGVAWVARRGGGNAARESTSAPVAASSAVAVPAAVSAPTEAPPIEVASVPAASASSSQVAPSPAPHRVDPERSVAAEVAILHRVSDALRAGDPKSALVGVDEHARRFPNGTLAEERDMERIVALCALGRRDEATRDAARFARAFPSSSYDARIHEACAATPPAGDAP